MGTNAEYKEVGIIFGVGKTSVHDAFKMFLDAAMTDLVPRHIKMPTEHDFSGMAADFEQRWQCPVAIGAIDGCHFNVTVPADQAVDNFNYKSYRSVLSIAICDANYRVKNFFDYKIFSLIFFIFQVFYVKSGIPGKTNDAGAFAGTELFALESGSLLPNKTRSFDGLNVPFHLLGDSAFVLKPWLMKPFIFSEEAPEDQRLFNKRHSRTRRVIENVFGRLKGRWRRLYKRFEIKVEDAGKYIEKGFLFFKTNFLLLQVLRFKSALLYTIFVKSVKICRALNGFKAIPKKSPEEIKSGAHLMKEQIKRK